MVDDIIKVVLKAEEQANKQIMEAYAQADTMKDSPNKPSDQLYDTTVTTCKKEAEASRELAKKKAAERSKRIMEDCESEVAKIQLLGQKNMDKAVELILKEITSGAHVP